MRRWSAALAIVAATVAPAAAQQPEHTPGDKLGLYAYPLKQQSSETQRHDEALCYGFATTDTGINPGAATRAPGAVAASHPSAQRMSSFRDAYTACLEGSGYSVR